MCGDIKELYISIQLVRKMVKDSKNIERNREAQLPQAATSEKLLALLSPRSIAVVGASDKRKKLGGRILRHLRRHGYEGDIWPVNPSHDMIEGLPCYPSVATLPGVPDLGLVVLTPEASVSAVEALAAQGAKACAVLASGFNEIGPHGALLERRMAIAAQQHGMLLLGPNTLGFVNAFDRTAATFSQFAEGDITESPVAFVSQSGAFGTAIAGLARARQIGMGWFVNTGNEAVLDIWDILDAAIDNEHIRVLAGYVENLGDGRKMARVALRAAIANKPMVITKVGNSTRGAEAAAAHTGALATPARLFAGVAAQMGIIPASDERDMLNVIETILRAGRLKGRRLGIVSMSGGAGVLMADLAEKLRMPLADLSIETRTHLSKCVPSFGSCKNPVDITAQFIAQPDILERTICALQDDQSVDCVIVWLQMMDNHSQMLAKSLARCRDASSTPILIAWIAAAPETKARLQTLGLANFDNGGDAVRAAAALAGCAEAVVSLAEAKPYIPCTPRPQNVLMLGPEESAAVLDGCGVQLAKAVIVQNESEAKEAVADDGSYVFKIASPDIAHKSDIGCVILNVKGSEGARAAYSSLIARASSSAPGAIINGVTVQPMVSAGVELVFGARHDEAFGPIVMLGFGGIFVEILASAEFAVAPVSTAQARAMIAALPAQGLFDGARGLPSVDRDALAHRFAAFSQFVESTAGWIDEIDLNPVIVRGDDALAVDWLVSATSPYQNFQRVP